MTNQEAEDFANRQIALTFLEGFLENNDEKMRVVREYIPDEELIQELASIGTILARTISIIAGEDATEELSFKRLRRVLNDYTPES